MNNKKNLIKFGKMASKTIEIISWIGVACLLFCIIAACAAPQWTEQHVLSGITLNGVSVNVGESSGNVTLAAVLAMLFGAAVGEALIALLFGQMYKVLKSAEDGSPFRAENVRRVENIGWLAIALPVVGLITSVLVKLLGSPDAFEISVDLTSAVMGLLVLCLSQFFARGVELEQDVDGLV